MLQYLKNKYEGNEDIVFLSIQTVFEGHLVNDSSRLRQNQTKYDLDIPFGHDDGSNTGSEYSNILDNYRTGGTPWHIIINKEGTVVFNGFHVEQEEAVGVITTALGG